MSTADDFWTWLVRNSTQGPDLLNGHDARLDAQHALQSGVTNAQNSIGAAYTQAGAALSPYQQAGNEDFNNNRNLTYSGYYDTPYSGTYKPLSYNPSPYNPGGFDQKTQSFSGSQQRQPWTPGSPAETLSQPGLPPMPNMPHTDFGAPGASGMMGGGAGDLTSQIKAILDGTHPGPDPTQSGIAGASGGQMPDVVKNGLRMLTPDALAPSVQGTAHGVMELGRGIRQLANGDFIDGAGRILKSGLAPISDVADSLYRKPVRGAKNVIHTGHQVYNAIKGLF